MGRINFRNHLSIYLKYSNQPPVKINSKFIGKKKRTKYLDNVADLIAAYKDTAGPIGEVTLHTVLNGGVISQPLNQGLLLSDLTDGRTEENPLLIRRMKSPLSSLGLYKKPEWNEERKNVRH